ncbi:MAG: hypothetical protein JNJ77_20000 [Planctomycetia bacterium]|nr:hypothetical protein [Planctomycetia bacterium]
MILLDALAWSTMAAALGVFCIVAGPASNRPFTERLLLWMVFATLLGASLHRIVGIYDPYMVFQAKLIGYVIMTVTRCVIAVLSLVLIVRWVAQCPWWKNRRTVSERVGDYVAGYRR